MNRSPRRIAALVLAGLCAAASAQTMPSPDAAAACQALAGLELPASRFSLPTGGAVVNSAVLVRAQDAGNRNGEYCKVLGRIRPVDPTAPHIGFQVNLPSDWNGKALQFGGGGYNGNIPNTVGAAPHGIASAPTPLAQGYVTLASDSGHQARDANDASFALNDEALVNYAGQHIKKTRDAALALVQQRYGSPARRLYFMGGSTGGREALSAALRWPEAYDGVVSYYPTANFMGLRLWGSALARAIYPDGSAGWIPPVMVSRIASEALQACDPLDGVTDGLVSHMGACRARSAALLESLRCRNGETGHPAHCLTAAQLGTIAVYHEGYRLPYALANGIRAYAGYNSLEGVTMQLGSQAAYIDPPPTGPNAHHVNRADQFVKYFLVRDPAFKLLDLDIQNPGAWQSRIVALSQLIDANHPDWSAFAARGGKLLLVQGHDDPSVSPHANQAFYESVVARSGAAAAEGFVRFYLVPGLAHGDGKFRLAWDGLGTLDAWADRGVAPQVPVGFDANAGNRNRSRPMCAFPTWPRYLGSGPVDEAASYTCAAP